MKEEPIIVEQTYPVPVDKVWKAISDRNEMQAWYFDLAAFRPDVGFEFSFMGGTEQKTYKHLCKVTASVFQKKLAYSWKYEGYPGISVVTFELFPEGSKTRLRLTHEGLDSFPSDNPDFRKENFVQGWNDIIKKNLSEYLAKK